MGAAGIDLETSSTLISPVVFTTVGRFVNI